MEKFDLLPKTQVQPGSGFARPEALPEIVHLNDRALDSMVDFTRTKPLIIGPDENLDAALNEMKVTGRHMLLVTDDEDGVMGIVTTEDVLGDKPIREARSRGLEVPKLSISMVMMPIKDVLAFDLKDLEFAKIGHIVEALKHYQQHYALVIKTDESGRQEVRGLFSSFQLSKQLHQDINSGSLSTSSVAELHKRI